MVATSEDGEMRRIIAAVLVAGLALAVVGCSGSEPDAATEQPVAPAPAAATSADDLETTNRSPIESGTPEPFPALETTAVPAALTSKLEAGRPLLIFFYDTAELETKAQRAEVNAVLGEYRGLIDLVTFDVGSKEGGVASDAAKQAVGVANVLRVTSTPYIIIVDGNGFITWRWLGYVDRGIIDKEVLRATE
jgi:hypothetical protein